MRETQTNAELIETAPNIYTGVITLDSIQSGATNNIKLVVKWDDNEFFTEDDLEIGKSSDAKINIPISVNVIQYLGEEITKYQVTELPQNGYTTPYLPDTTYSIVSGTDLNNGLVIQDANENQFVWIVVPKSETIYNDSGLDISEFTDDEYSLIEKDLQEYTSKYKTRSGYSDIYYSVDTTGLSSSEYSQLKKKMLKSIYTNGGFWIGKYEAGDSTATQNKVGRNENTGYNNNAVIKANQIPYNFITCKQSQIVAQRFAPENTEYTTSLPFGIQWDLILQYIEKSGVYYAELKGGDSMGATNWGNYNNASFVIKNINAMYSINAGSTWKTIDGSYSKMSGTSTVLTTGAFESRNSYMNICDFAGNVCEWTLEYSGNNNSPATNRGSYYGDSGASNTPIAAWSNSINNNMSNNGFRVALY